MRKRHNGRNKERHITATNSSDRESDDETATSRSSGYANLVHCTAWILLHVMAGLLLVEGMRRNHRLLYTSEECTMTYSRRQFLPLELGEEHPKYGLYKFMDARDPRHRTYVQQFVAAEKNASFVVPEEDATDWCSTVTTVLYVPGHFGSFEQSRSLGAHGVQLTERFGGNAKERALVQRLQKLAEKETVPDDDMDWFYYDVFAIDFQEEGGAFHSSLLERQAAYIRDVVLQLIERCSDTTTGAQHERIHIVAHSIGGMSARLALHKYPSLRNFVKDIITVGTPHRVPVWTWDVSLWNMYATMAAPSSKNGEENSVAVLSIAGGLRDAMIPAEACGGNNLMPMLAHHGDKSLGMDHKAIVWCADVLERVRSVLFSIRSEETVEAVEREFRSLVPGDGAAAVYRDGCEEQLVRMKTLYSYVGGTLMEAGLLHNAEHLVFLFTTIGSLRYLNIMPTVALVLAMGLLLLRVHVTDERSYSVPAVLLLALNSHAVFMTVHTMVRLVSSTRRRPFSTQRLAQASIATTAILSSVLWYTSDPRIVTLASVGTIFATLFTFLLVFLKGALQRYGTNDRVQERQLALTTLAIPLLPLLILGELVALTEGLVTWKAIIMLIPVCLRFAMAGSVLQLRSRKRSRWWRIVDVVRWGLLGFYVTTMVFYTEPTSTRLFHPMAALVMGLAMVDAVEQSLVWL